MSRFASSWRDVLPIHPAADMFPMLSRDELIALADDIQQNGLRSPVVLDDRRRHLLDGRNRLDAMECAGIKVIDAAGNLTVPTITAPRGMDAHAFVISANIRRRHLTAEQKRELIAELLKADPEQSNRQIAEQTKSDHKTVGSVRHEQERRGEIPHVGAAKDKAGRKQAVRKPSTCKFDVAAALEAHSNRVGMIKADLLRFSDDQLDELLRVVEEEIARRRKLASPPAGETLPEDGFPEIPDFLRRGGDQKTKAGAP